MTCSRRWRGCPSDLTVHVSGETGTGKEALAKALHARSGRARGPFVAVNASSLGDELFETEMFGHGRGAFTGAIGERDGYVAAADGGTLFLDEVADLSPRAQARLLRFLEEREYRRVGGTRVRGRRARGDRGQRVAGLPVAARPRLPAGGDRPHAPPLRERGGNVAAASHFLADSAVQTACPAGLGAEARRALAAHPGRARPRAAGEIRRRWLWPRADTSAHLSEALRAVARPIAIAPRSGGVLEREYSHGRRASRGPPADGGRAGITRQALAE